MWPDPNCPKLKGSVQVAAICREDAPDEGRNMEVDQEQDDEYHPVTALSVGEPTDDWVEEPSQYNWDETNRKSDSGGTVTYRSSAVCIPSRYGMPTCKAFGVRFISKESSLSNEGSMQPQMVVTVDKSAEPLYHHRSYHQPPMCPERPCEENQTISGYWEIIGT